MAFTAPEISVAIVELWVRDLEDAQRCLTDAFGFRPLDSSASDPATADLACGGVWFRLRQGGTPENEISRHVARHGDTAVDVALACSGIDATVERARSHGLAVSTSDGRPRVDILGDRAISHTLYDPGSTLPAANGGGLDMKEVDHITYCLPHGTAETVADAYVGVFGLEEVDITDFRDVGGTAAGMRSFVLRSGRFKVVLTEPLSAHSTGQTQMFLDAHGGPGLQHAAVSYDDLVSAVESLRSRDVEFLAVPPQYFDHAETRLNDPTLPWEALRRLDILVDSDEHGLLFQLFTRPLSDRPTMFLELIQRAGSTGFGANNVRALFAAVHQSTGEGPAEEAKGT
jgi:4-hydroxyphenylpyruvate dioxygenase